MTINELYQWALEREFENEELYIEDEYGKRLVELTDLNIRKSGIVIVL